MSKTEELLSTQWNAACANVGAMTIKLVALKRQVTDLEADIDRAAAMGITLDQSAHWAAQVEKAIVAGDPTG